MTASAEHHYTLFGQMRHRGSREDCMTCPRPSVESADYEQWMESVIIDLFNPADTEDYDPERTLRDVAEYVTAQPCTCEPEPDYPGEYARRCDRCLVLGQAGGKRLEP